MVSAVPRSTDWYLLLRPPDVISSLLQTTLAPLARLANSLGAGGKREGACEQEGSIHLWLLPSTKLVLSFCRNSIQPQDARPECPAKAISEPANSAAPRLAWLQTLGRRAPDEVHLELSASHGWRQCRPRWFPKHHPKPLSFDSDLLDN